jgi:hypothetical protein
MRNLIKLLLATLMLTSGASVMALEEPEYEILHTVGDIEIRQYDPYIVAEVSVNGASADRKAFGILAGYIFGENESGTEMAMTAPVETRGSEYAFVMERQYSMETLPQPDDSRINLRNKPARVVAVLRFSGRWTERNFRKHEELLLAQLAELGIAATGEPELARYNSPFTLWFLRRNEIIVAVDWNTFVAGN